jgi:hypothetical protein
MLSASDALRAHDDCRARLAAKVGRRINDPSEYREFAPDHECLLVRFIRENTGAPDLEPELSQLRTAHATVHRVAIALALKHAEGQDIDIDAEFAPCGNFGAASSSLTTAIRRLDKKLRSLTHKRP